MSGVWQSLIDGARDLDRSAAVETVLTEPLTRFDVHCASDQSGCAVAELYGRCWRLGATTRGELWAVSGGDDAA